MKNLTDEAVRDVALDLITKNGKTSTLDIKMELRNLGYFAVQAEVGRRMNLIHAAYGMDYVFNGQYREYIMYQMPIGAAAPTGTASAMATAITKVMSAPVETNNPEKGDWELSFNGSSPYAYYESGASRNAVRYAYATTYGVPYVDTRCKLVK